MILHRARSGVVVATLVVAALFAAAALVASAGCAVSPARDREVSEALAGARLPVAAPGTMARDSLWRVYIEDGGTSRLFLIYQVAALALPDGPFELLAPITYFRYDGSQWRQDTQQRGGIALPPAVETALASEWLDTTQIYFYRVWTTPLTNADAAVGALSSAVRAASERTVREASVWRRDGFIGADAAP